MAKIYDGFIFFNELDLLDIRLNTLNDVVDYFILVEASVTHQGASKPFIFDENKSRFSQYLDKIIHIKIDNIPEKFNSLSLVDASTYKDKCYNSIIKSIKSTSLFDVEDVKHNGFGRDFFQKECVKLGMEFADDNDILIFSDVDEIPNPEILKRLDEFYNEDDLYTFEQLHYCYFLNGLYTTHINNSKNNFKLTNTWHGSCMGCWKNLQSLSLNELRAQDNNLIIDGGWHFSWMGGLDRVLLKIKSYSHLENNNVYNIKSMETLYNQNTSFKDFRGGVTNIVKIDYETHPGYLVENQEKFKNLIKD